MNKRDLAIAVQRNALPAAGMSNCSRVVDAVLNAMSDALSLGDKVSLQGFGSFQVKDTKPRRGVNPATGEAIQIPAKRKVTFKPSPALKETLNS